MSGGTADTVSGNTVDTVSGNTVSTANGNIYTLKKEYLATLPTGAQGFTFDMSGGADPVLPVTITNTALAATATSTQQTVYTVLSHFEDFTGSGTVSARIDADYTKFRRVLYNGQAVDPAHYTITSGSTIITFSENYLRTLSNGTHWYTVEFNNGVSADIRLLVNMTVSISPKTGGDSHVLIWWIVLAGALLGIFGIVIWYRRAGRRL